MKTYQKIFVAIAIASLIVLFAFVFPGKLILSQGFSFGSVSLRYYGMLMALGILVAYFIAKHRGAKFNLPADLPDRLLIPIVVFGFIGARLYHVLSSLDYYQQNPVEIFQVWHGGLGVYGAIAGVVIALWIASRWVIQPKTSLLELFDWLVPPAIVAHMFVRLGNFFNYELYGYATNLPWKMFVPDEFRAPAYQTNNYYHPLFLYEIVLLGLMLLIFRKIESKQYRAGTIFLLYILLYNSGRFFLEFLRVDTVFIDGIRQNAVVSAVLAIIALVYLIVIASDPEPVEGERGNDR